MSSKFPVTWIVLLGLMLGISIAAVMDSQKIDDSNFVFGSAHEHASLAVKIQGASFDFTLEKYQLQSPFIHFENNNGYVVHRHSVGVTIGYLFETLNFGLSKECIVIDDGRKFCTDNVDSLKFFINGRQVENIRDYIIFDGDIILISYGDETQNELEQQFKEQIERGFPFQIRDRNANNLAKV